jgi:hypothetical protein
LHVTFNQRYKIADSDLYILHLQRYAIDDDGLSFKITDDEPKTESIMGPYRSTKSDRENTIDVDGTVEEETRITTAHQEENKNKNKNNKDDANADAPDFHVGQPWDFW